MGTEGLEPLSDMILNFGNYIPDDLAGKHERHTALNTLLEQKGI